MPHKNDRFFEDLEEEISFWKSAHPHHNPPFDSPAADRVPQSPVRSISSSRASDRPASGWSPGTSARPKHSQGRRIPAPSASGLRHRTSHVLEARTQMHESGVATIVFVADRETHTLIGPIRLETRGLAEIHEARNIHRILIKASRDSYEQTLKDVPDIEEKDLLKIIKGDVGKALMQELRRNPMIIPIVIAV